MRANRINSDEQFRLIMECRNSGLSDHQWCTEHNIKPGTFYNWIKRLRQKGCTGIPEATRCRTAQKQEIVQIKSVSNEHSAGFSEMIQQSPTVSRMEPQVSFKPALELILSGSILRISNETDPRLLEEILHILRDVSC